jgi:tricorn protease
MTVPPIVGLYGLTRRSALVKRLALAFLAWLLLAVPDAVQGRENIFLAANPSLSPDGTMLAFDWNGDIWTVPTSGGVARQLTQHPARDREPKFSPDGKEIAFTSEREGSYQVYVMPAEGGTPEQLTYHTAGYSLQGWLPDGKGLLVQAARDHFWRHPERFFRIPRAGRVAEQPLFDDYGNYGTLSPNGKQLLFTREGPAWWRKGYHGSQASQIWLYDLEKKSFTRLLDNDRGSLWPLWKPDGKGFYYVGGQSGSFNLWEHDLGANTSRQLTQFKDDSVVFPCIARDGSTIVFRHLFDLYAYHPASAGEPKKIEICHANDRISERKQNRVLQQASAVSFTQDGLEIAFIAGGDLWVMDTELREPRQVTATPEDETVPVFSPDDESILFVSGKNGKTDVWKAERADKDKYWWQNSTFKLTQLTSDGEAKSALTWSPDGTRIAYVRGRGDLWSADAQGQNARKLFASWNAPDYNWSPDGKWFVYAQSDNDFNRDIWLMPSDGSGKPFNLSRHPYNESNPVWSPDGKVIAFSGQRASGQESSLCFVFLKSEDNERDSRDRTLEKAVEKISKARKAGAGKRGESDTPAKTTPRGGRGETPAPAAKKPAAPVVIDREKIHHRVRRVAFEAPVSNLFWSPDSKKLAFSATIDGRSGVYTIDVPDDLRPKLVTAQRGTQAHWLPQGNQVAWLANGVPATFSATGGAAAAPTPALPSAPGGGRRGRGPAPATAPAASSTSEAGSGSGTAYTFQALQEVDLPKKHAAAFDLCWRTMRDQFYDEHLGNRDWDAVRRKYVDMAAQAPDMEAFGTVVNLMLGELNGSHLGFMPGGGAGGPPGRRGGPRADTPASTDWRDATAHMGVRFVGDYKGRGLKVRDILPGGPADQKKSRIVAGDVIVSINGKAVDPGMDLTLVLNGPLPRDFKLKVKNSEDKEREVMLRPTTYAAARLLLYEQWLEENRKKVEEASKGTLGYLHISGMNMPSFHKFEEELYSVGSGKDGLVIDVRENGGGSTADLLLTALTQPVHAITVPRGGGTGYPQDRKIFSTWNKPIVVLCNQNSFSNAEIFSHAIKTLKRGPLVGAPTAGGVISTGAATIMDVGTLRLPFRGWHIVNTGEDMELNGAVPDHILWPEPGQMPQGKDIQLQKAVAVLLGDVQAYSQRPQPKLRKATER